MRRARFISVIILSLIPFSSAQRIAAANAWSQLAELTPTTRANQDWFGVSAAVSGNTAVVGAFDANIENTGVAYVFVKPSSGWGNMTQTAMLKPSDGGEGFGTSVAISGNTIVVGAANASNEYGRSGAQTQGPGAAYIFVKPASGWKDMTETAKITASDGVGGDAFGYNVSISGKPSQSAPCLRTVEQARLMSLLSLRMAGPR